MSRIAETLETIGIQWLKFVRLIEADPSIPVPLMPLSPFLEQAPCFFKWTNPKDSNKKVLAMLAIDQQCIKVDVTGQGWDSYRVMKTPEEAFAAIKAVFSQ